MNFRQIRLINEMEHFMGEIRAEIAKINGRIDSVEETLLSGTPGKPITAGIRAIKYRLEQIEARLDDKRHRNR